MAAERVLLDTSLIVAATVEAHPGWAAARTHVEGLLDERVRVCMTPQVCREFLVVLTRGPVSGRTFTEAEAIAALDSWREGCLMLDENAATVDECAALVEEYGVKGKQIHDANLVAVMRVHGINRLATRNAKDFVRYTGLTIDAVTP